MYETAAEVIYALKRYRDVFQPISCSIIGASRQPGYDPTRDPFRAGFLSGIELRCELVHRMLERLNERERLLLLLWYVYDQPAARIANRLEISRVHCYRLRDHALDALCDDDKQVDNPRDRDSYHVTSSRSASANDARVDVRRGSPSS